MKHLALNNFLESGLAKRYKIDNFPSFEAVEALSELVETILDPLWDAFGKALYVSRGFMTEKLNALSGCTDSIHVRGYAADVVPLEGGFPEFMTFAENWLRENDIAFDVSQEEIDKDGNHYWHIALYGENKEQRKQFIS